MNAPLPPLILHPFSSAGGSESLIEGSRAWLALQGVLPSDEEKALLEARMLAGRYQEIKMLLFVGKDVSRWLGQCVEFMETHEPGVHYVEQSFAALLVEKPPLNVRAKLELWGVSGFRQVFSRAIGMYSLFAAPPEIETLSPVFLRNYHRFADHAFICYQHLHPFQALDPEKFPFEMFASEEYARLLSNEWENA